MPQKEHAAALCKAGMQAAHPPNPSSKDAFKHQTFTLLLLEPASKKNNSTPPCPAQTNHQKAP